MSQNGGEFLIVICALWFFIVLVSVILTVISFICWGKIGKKCGFSFWWTAILMSLPIANLIMFFVLGFSKKKEPPKPD